MSALFSRLKNWAAEKLTNEDLNAEIDNILDNFAPDQMGDYSANVSQMQETTDPGEVGSESLATSTAGELERLRFAVGEIKGTDQWYETANSSIAELASALGGGLSANRISSGLSSSNSDAPRFLDPAGSGNGRSVTLRGSGTSFVYFIGSTQYTISSDVVASSLLAAPSSQNTALVNDASLSDQEFSKNVGEYGSSISIDNAGTEITSLVGNYAAFKINNGSDDEYFFAYVESSTKLTQVQRGYFYDTNGAQVTRIPITNNDTITLLKLTWIYAKSDGTLAVSYTNPTVSYDEPQSPAVGDYWFDLNNNIWKNFDSVSFVDATAILIGLTVQDDTDCLGARSIDFFRDHDSKNTIRLVKSTSSLITTTDLDQDIKVYGQTIRFGKDLAEWDITGDLDTGSEAADTTYYLYVTEDGDTKISVQMPHDRRGDLKGFYHPAESWRCVGQVHNDASSDFIGLIDYNDVESPHYEVSADVDSNALTIKLHASPVHKFKFRADSADPDGETAFRSLISPQEITVPSGATMGHYDGAEARIYVYVVEGSSAFEIAVCSSFLDDSERHSTTAIGTGSDDASVLYAASAQSDKRIRLFGFVDSNQTTAGTYAAAPTKISSLLKPGVALKYPAQVHLDSGNGFGSVATATRRFSFVRGTVGSSLLVTQSAANGDSVTIKEKGRYNVQCSDANSVGSGSDMGIAVNASSGTTSAIGLTYAQGKRAVSATPNANIIGSVCVTLDLDVGDVITYQPSTAMNLTSDNAVFRVVKVF